MNNKQVRTQSRDAIQQVLHDPRKSGDIIKELFESKKHVDWLLHELLNHWGEEEILHGHLPEAYELLGYEGLVDLLNQQLENPLYSIDFHEDDFSEGNGGFDETSFKRLEFLLQTIRIEKPDPTDQRVGGWMKGLYDHFDVHHLRIDDTHIYLTVSCGEAPMVHSVAHAAHNVSNKLGPFIRRKVENVGIENYDITFTVFKKF